MMNEQPIVDEEPEVSERDVMIGIRTQICDTEIEIAAIEAYGVKSQRGYLAQLKGRLKSLKTQFHVYKTLWK
jgi:hypothetical protein